MENNNRNGANSLEDFCARLVRSCQLLISLLVRVTYLASDYGFIKLNNHLTSNYNRVKSLYLINNNLKKTSSNLGQTQRYFLLLPFIFAHQAISVAKFLSFIRTLSVKLYGFTLLFRVRLKTFSSMYDNIQHMIRNKVLRNSKYCAPESAPQLANM
uniref:Uncharacterized protein n=1 Tax=Glossina brevipalpis TaxID=37001 RepID=A0A1A9WZL5_9MUSC